MLTYFDVVEHLITSSFGGPQDAEQRDIRTAVQRSYSEVTQIRDWAYYHVHGRLITSPPQDAGTVQVSGSTVTLTGATWPAWALRSHIRVGDTIGRIGAVTSSTVATLDIGFTENHSAGTPYTLYRVTYPLPSDFRNLDEPSDEYNWWSGLYITPDVAMKLERVANSSGAPYHWTVIKDPDSDGWAIKLLGYPTKAETIDFIYRRTARTIRYSGHEPRVRSGLISISSGSTAVSGDNSVDLPSDVVGSILRVGTTTDSPGPQESISPFLFESTIASRADEQAVTLSQPSPILVNSHKYLVTDPIDVPPHMHNVIYSAAEYWLARIRNQKPDDAFAMYQRDLRLAMEMDQLAPLSGRSKEIWHSGGWKSPLRPDEGI